MTKLLAQLTLPEGLGTINFPAGRIPASDTSSKTVTIPTTCLMAKGVSIFEPFH